MASKPITSEAIAITEKKMDMSLDDIIKMSKSKDTKNKKQRVSNRGRKLFKGVQDKSQKMRQYLNSRSSLRQGALAQRRSNFQGNRFPLTSEAARKATLAPIRDRGFIQKRTTTWKPRFSAVAGKQGNASRPATGSTGKLQQQQQQQNKPKTLDSLFANMKEQRLRTSGGPGNSVGRGPVSQQRQQWGRGRGRFGDHRSKW